MTARCRTGSACADCRVAREEVADFVNANLATGYAEPATDPAADTTAPAPRGGGLLDRIRGR